MHFGVRGIFLGEQCIRIVKLRAYCLVPHFLDHDHRGVLIKHLIDGHHAAELHQRLDHLGSLH